MPRRYKMLDEFREKALRDLRVAAIENGFKPVYEYWCETYNRYMSQEYCENKCLGKFCEGDE